MSETNEIISVIRADEKRRLLFLLQHKIAVDYPKELSPEENKRRILRDIYRKKVDRYGFKTKYFNSIVFNSNIYSLIYPFAGEFALTFSNGQFLPFNERKNFDIHKVYRLDITNSDELKNYDFELSDIHAENLEDYIDGSENPQNSVHYIVKILDKIKYNNKNWTVIYFLYFFLINSQSCKKPCYIIFLITRYTIWTLFLIVLFLRFLNIPRL
uniref:Uncharacterized protein n=1 Tax=Strongyloides venezuelensis TaxID=75913 RepID=A0A0K0FH04_STRVS